MDFRNVFNWMCKFVVFLGYVCSDVFVWIIVMVIVECFFVICKLFYFWFIFILKRFIKFWLFVLIVVFFVVNCYFFFMVELCIVYNVSLCYLVDLYDFLVYKIWFWIDVVLYLFVFIIIIFVFNVKIVL